MNARHDTAARPASKPRGCVDGARRMALTVLLGVAPFFVGATLPATASAMSNASTNGSPAATPAMVYPLPVSWQEWGSGEMRFFGFRLYRATLWVAGADIEASPHALTLHYHRDISREQLVSASLDEMRRLGTADAAVERWKTDLNRVFPDVKEGDRIIGLHLPGKGARFFHQGKLTGEVNDPEFARRFFAIWLDPRTRSPDVRSLLLKRPAVTAGG